MTDDLPDRDDVALCIVKINDHAQVIPLVFADYGTSSFAHGELEAQPNIVQYGNVGHFVFLHRRSLERLTNALSTPREPPRCGEGGRVHPTGRSTSID